MDTLAILQSYWWLLIAVLGAALVFLLFVQGGQSMLMCRFSDDERQLMANSLGRKWEFTYTTLVVFGGAFLPHSPCSTAPVSVVHTGFGCLYCSVSYFRL